MLPFEHFIYSEFSTGEETETLKIVFATHEVVLRGRLLRRLEQAMQRTELAFVTAIPERYHALVGETQPMIREVAVITPRSEEREQPSGEEE